MKNWLYYFEEISKIPRGSLNEEGVREYLINFAKENSIECLRDKTGNIILKVPATEGCETVPTIILQGHMDMVCVKEASSKHDFLKDPIEIIRDGDFLRANKTTLGADDGISIALALSVITDKELKHGKIECLFTWNEESGMDGASSLEENLLEGRYLINIDSEDEGVFYIGCAGGAHVKGELKVERLAVPSDWQFYSTEISGLPGGHSGMQIALDIPNAIKKLGENFSSLEEFMICEINGGERANVIPSSATCTFAVPAGKLPLFNCKKCSYSDKAVSIEDSARILGLIEKMPHGVKSWSSSFENVVDTSDNLAMISLDENCFNILVSVRSLSEEGKNDFVDEISDCMKGFGLSVSAGAGYPSWQPTENSAFLKNCCNSWRNCFGKDPVITAVHAGLECSILKAKLPGLECVSTGPDTYDIHSANEHVSISSTDRVLQFLRNLVSCNLI